MPIEGDLAAPRTAEASGRPDRATLIAFVSDLDSERMIREGLSDALPGSIDIRRGGIRFAISTLQSMPTPRVLVVDVSDDEQPLTSLADLSEVVEPDVQVLVVGDRKDMNFYRQLIRGMGIVEYLYKPLTREMVARHFGIAFGRTAAAEAPQGGRFISITGVTGGAGTTTIAVNLAWYLAETAKRHTLLIDPDLHTGTAATMLAARTGPGLRIALETPQRIDELFIERSAQPVGKRLQILAGEEQLVEQPSYTEGAAGRLIQYVRRRYNFIVGDIAFRPSQINREFLDLSQQRVFVMEPTLTSIRDMLRFLALPQGPQQSRRAVIVLNHLGQPGCLSRQQVETALAVKVDIVIPYLPRHVTTAANLGEPAITRRGAFQTGIVNLAQEVGSVFQTSSGRVSLKKTLRSRLSLRS